MSIVSGLGLGLQFSNPPSGGAALPAVTFASVNGPTTGPYLAGMTSGVFEGYSVEFSGTPSIPDPDGVSPLTFQSDRPGFDATGAATTYRDTLYVTKQMRQSWPNNLSMTAHTAILSDYIYVNDVLTGATNNSTIVSPKPVCAWSMPDHAVIGGTLTWEIVAGHRNARGQKQVACAIPRVTGKVSGVTTTVTYAAVSTLAISAYPGDYGKVLVLGSALDVSTFDDNQELILNVKVYPWLGAASSVADSGDGTFTARKDFSPRYFYRNTTKFSTPPYAYINSGGNDGTGVISTTAATASASPFLTFAGFMAALKTFGDSIGLIVRVGAGSPNLDGPATGSVVQSGGWMTITRDPAVARASAIVGVGVANNFVGFQSVANTPNTSALRFTDITVTRTGAFGIKGNATYRLEIFFQDVAMDFGALTSTWLNNSDDWIFGMTATNNSTGGSLNASSTGQHRMTRGLTITTPGTMECNTQLGCNITSSSGNVVSNGLTCDGQVIAFNRFDGVSGGMFVGQTTVTNGCFWAQNEVAFTSATGNTTVAVSNDSKTNSTYHIVCHNNTFGGTYICGRGNNNYDDGTTERFNRLASYRGNIWPQVNVKGDIFHGANEGNPEGFTSGSPSTRVGDWQYLNGVGCFDELWGWASTTATGNPEYNGLRAKGGTSQATTPTYDPLYTTSHLPTCTAGGTSPTFSAGSTGSVLTLQAGSVCKAAMPDSLFPYDFGGNARPATGDSIGAWV